MKGLALVLTLVMSASAPSKPVLGTIPAYPGATRPVPRLETRERAIAFTADKPEAVIAYYMHGLVAAGWTPSPETPYEATSARPGDPVWLKFDHAGLGAIDVIITTGKHPKTGKPVTLITYETHFKP